MTEYADRPQGSPQVEHGLSLVEGKAMPRVTLDRGCPLPAGFPGMQTETEVSKEDVY